MNFYPFVQSLELSSRRSAEEVLERLMTGVKPVEIGDTFKNTVLPRGTAIGATHHNVFELREARYGFGDAAATGIVIPAAGGSLVKARVQAGLLMSFGIPVLTVAYGLIAFLYVRYFALQGLSTGRVLAFAGYTAFFAAGWVLMTLETRGVRRLLVDAADVSGALR